MFLFFDSETSCFVDSSLPPDHPNQCHLVELGAVLCDEDGTERASFSMIVKPTNWTITSSAAAVHGITQEVAERCGVDVEHVVTSFCHLLDRAEKAFAFNMPFDRNVLSLELIRLGEPRPVEWPSEVELVCIMELAREALRIPPTSAMKRAGRFGPKNPKLSEAYEKLFDEELIGAHSALADTRAAMRVWFKLNGLGEPGRNGRWGYGQGNFGSGSAIGG